MIIKSNLSQKTHTLLWVTLLCFFLCSCTTDKEGITRQDTEVVPASVEQNAGNTGQDAVNDNVQSAQNDDGLQQDGNSALDEPLMDVSVEREPDMSEASSLSMEEHAGKYYYESLNADEQLWYREMYAVMIAMETEMVLSKEANETVGADGLDKIFNCVMNDNPNLFYVEGYTYTLYTYGEELDRVAFSGTYSMSRTEKEEIQVMIDSAVDTCLAGVSLDASQYEKVKYVYEYIIFSTEYDLMAPDNQNICSVFLGGRSVCQGYAKAIQYLLNELGMEATLVVGSVHNTESHAWNLVKVDGEYYYLDATWGDASYQVQGDAAGVASLPNISYDYLCVPYSEMSQTHTVNSVADMPACTAMAANYYVMEGAYFYEYDETALEAFFEKGYSQEKAFITFRCADATVFNTVFDELITNQKIFGFLENRDGKIAYARDEGKLSMTFWLVNE